MPPGRSPHDQLDVGSVDSKPSSQLPGPNAFQSQAANGSNVIFVELGVVPVGSPRPSMGTADGSMPSLLGHVAHVVGVRSKKQVVRVHTGWLIAPVAHLHASWDVAMLKNPGHSIGPLNLPASGDEAIPLAIAAPGPKPAPSCRLRRESPAHATRNGRSHVGATTSRLANRRVQALRDDCSHFPNILCPTDHQVAVPRSI